MARNKTISLSDEAHAGLLLEPNASALIEQLLWKHWVDGENKETSKELREILEQNRRKHKKKEAEIKQKIAETEQKEAIIEEKQCFFCKKELEKGEGIEVYGKLLHKECYNSAPNEKIIALKDIEN